MGYCTLASGCRSIIAAPCSAYLHHLVDSAQGFLQDILFNQTTWLMTFQYVSFIYIDKNICSYIYIELSCIITRTPLIITISKRTRKLLSQPYCITFQITKSAYFFSSGDYRGHICIKVRDVSVCTYTAAWRVSR